MSRTSPRTSTTRSAQSEIRSGGYIRVDIAGTLGVRLRWTAALFALTCLAPQQAGVGLESKEPAERPREEILRWINSERARHGVSPLASEAILDRAAQTQAEETLAESDKAGETSSDQAQLAEYEHQLLSEIRTRGEGPVPRLLDSWRERESAAFAEAMRPDYRDLGIGLAGADEDLVCVLLLGLSAKDAFARKTTGLSDMKRIRGELIERVNRERKTRRLPPMRENALLDRAAEAHAQDMIRRSFYGHESPEGRTALDRVQRAGYNARAVGENIAEGQSTSAEVMDEWMASPVHRAHILSLEMLEIGCAVAFGKNARGYEIVWVQDFGLRAEPLSRRRF